MSQYYPQPPAYPPEADYEYDENDYEYQEDNGGDQANNSLIKYALAFFAGGCLIFLCMACCIGLAGGLWTLDGLLAATPVPGSDIGLSLDEPAMVDDAVVNEQNMRLTLTEVNRNVTLPTIPANPGRELIVLTIELENLSSEDVKYSLEDFTLINVNDEAYQPTAGDTLIQGALKRSGKLGTEKSIEGRLVFEVVAGEPELTLAWQPEGDNVQTRFIALQ